MSLFVDLAFPVEVNKTFTYIVPPELHDVVKPGVRALVPFGKRTAVGFIVSISDKSPIRNLKSIYDILDDNPLLSDELLQLTKWISEYYFAPWGEVLKAALPPGSLQRSKRLVTLTENVIPSATENFSMFPKNQAAILRHLAKRKRQSIRQLQNALKLKSIYAAVNTLAKQGYVTVSEKQSSFQKPKIERVVEINNETKVRWNEWKSAMEREGNVQRMAKQITMVEDRKSVV